MVATLFARKDVTLNAAFREERHSDKCRDLPHSYASKIRALNTFKEAIKSENFKT